MDNIKTITRRSGVDIGYHNTNLHPENRQGCVGESGIDKNYTFEQVLELAYNMKEKPNIIVKAGRNAKWYLKKIQIEEIESAIEKQKWRKTHNYEMYIIE
jgi:hypothetical protein